MGDAPRNPGNWDVLPHGLGNIVNEGQSDVDRPPGNRISELGASEHGISDNVTEDLGMTQDNQPTKKKKTTNIYRISYTQSPFPDHLKPSPEECDEVYRILVKEHGEVKQPATIPPPSKTVTGCGEVPDLLDALLRTLVSSATTMKNSNTAFSSLAKRFPAPDGGETTVRWEDVMKADEKEVADALNCGGLGKKKARFIKQILDVVFNDNCDRSDALLNEQTNGVKADILGIEGLTMEQKAAEIARIAKNPLSLDWLFELKENGQIMDEIVKLPGIGVKTASCAMLFNMRRPSFAVDTHVWRHCKWLNWVPIEANENKTFNHCDLRVPDHLKYALHQLFIFHGKSCFRCRAGTFAGTKKWNETECPIEHLVTRTVKGNKKDPTYKPSQKELKDSSVPDAPEGGAKKRKRDGDTDGNLNISKAKPKKRSKAKKNKQDDTDSEYEE